MAKQLGVCSMAYEIPVYIRDSVSVVGKKENEGPLKGLFDYVTEDDYMGQKTWEEGENELVKKAISLLLARNPQEASRVRYLLGGDLLGQGIGTSFGVEQFHLPFFGLYAACSTSGEGLLLGSALLEATGADYLVSVTSSHFASAEKEFRTPLDYGTQRPMCSTWTVTGSGAYLLERGNAEPGEKSNRGTQADSGNGKTGAGGKNERRVRITGVTPGRIVDFGVKDSMNMGCCMAPAAADTLMRHFADFDRCPGDYDRIITGDLGTVGREALLILLREKGIEISDKHMDCGIEMFDSATQQTNAGGSGCGCAATVLSAAILPKLRNGEWKRVVFMPTGALLSRVSFNEGKTIPGISHLIVLEAE